jgi:predicted P-loop ATPase
MWPVRVTRQIDVQWFKENREQLFAEAVHYVDAGERFHPTAKEQRELFEPQQQQRQIENAIQAAVLRYLYDENQRVAMSGENGTLVEEITAPDLLTRLGLGVDKQTHQLLRQTTAALRHAGWVRFRSSRGDRPWMFKRPKGSAGQEPTAGDSLTGSAPSHQPAGASDDCPF